MVAVTVRYISDDDGGGGGGPCRDVASFLL